MTRLNQLADGSTAPVGSLIDMAEQLAPNKPVDMSSIFPGPGTYAVTPTETFVYYDDPVDENRVPKTVRFKLNIDKVKADSKSNLIGRAFSIFFGVIEAGSDDNAAPISFTARRLYYLFNGEYPTENLSNPKMVWAWLRDIEGGMPFIIERTVKRDKNNVLRANDKLLSYETFKSSEGYTPKDPEFTCKAEGIGAEEAPEVAADAGNL